MQGATSIQRKEAVPATRKFPEKKKVLARRCLHRALGGCWGKAWWGRKPRSDGVCESVGMGAGRGLRNSEAGIQRGPQ